MIYRRRRQQYIFAGLLGVIAVVNVLFFFILNQPARAEYASLQGSIARLRSQSTSNKNYLGNLQKTSTELDRFDRDKRALLMQHLVQRKPGYSQIVTTLDAIVQRTGVKKTRVGYNQNPMPQAGLNTLTVVIPLEGSYGNIVSFIRELENSETFFLITAINLEGSGGSQSGPAAANAGGGGNVSLALTLETFFYQ